MESGGFRSTRSGPSSRRPDGPLRRPDAATRKPDAVVRRPMLAIDVGTAHSGAVLVTNERDVVVEDPHAGHALWPTSVAYDGVAPRIGGAAESFARVHPDRYRARLKQLLAEPGAVTLGETQHRPAELLGWLLTGMREQAEKLGGTTVERAVLSLPFGQRPGDLRRAALLEAAELAGFTTVELLTEPLAALASTITGGVLATGDIVLLTDFGAGSASATLASVLKNGVIEVLGHAERPECAGTEIDRLLMSELLTRAGRSWSDLARPTDDPLQRLRDARARRTLEQTANAMKHQLSGHPSAIELVGPEEFAVELTSGDLAAVVAPLVHGAVDSFRELLGAAGVRPGELTAVVLTGGGSRLPTVVEVVNETFRRPVRHTLDAQRAVVEGAARFARATEDRHVRARVATDRETPLRWEFPGGQGHELRWRVGVNGRFGASDALAVVRLDDGSIWELRPGRTGTLIRAHVADGATVASGDWLVTVELDVRPFR